MKGKFRKMDLRENNREGRLFYREKTKSNNDLRKFNGEIKSPNEDLTKTNPLENLN